MKAVFSEKLASKSCQGYPSALSNGTRAVHNLPHVAEESLSWGNRGFRVKLGRSQRCAFPVPDSCDPGQPLPIVGPIYVIPITAPISHGKSKECSLEVQPRLVLQFRRQLSADTG
jgi:hypothetical protein